MKTLKLTQGSEEWLEWRKTGLGASDAPIIMEESPWKTPYELWLEKTGKKEPVKANKWQLRGLDLEEAARRCYIKKTGNAVFPLCAQHEQYPWLLASFDGIDFAGNLIVEIKCAGGIDHHEALAGRIPKKYYPQLQHQMLVAGVDICHYFSFDGEDGVIVECPANPKYQEELLKKLQEFWGLVQNDIAPEAEEDAHIYIDHDEFKAAAAEWIACRRALTAAQEKESKAKAKLLDLTDDGNCFGGGVKCSKFKRKGSIDYKKIPELKGVDIDKYRGKDVYYWVVKEVSNENTLQK